MIADAMTWSSDSHFVSSISYEGASGCLTEGNDEFEELQIELAQKKKRLVNIDGANCDCYNCVLGSF